MRQRAGREGSCREGNILRGGSSHVAISAISWAVSGE